MSTTYGGVDYGTEARACMVAAMEYMAPFGEMEYEYTPSEIKVMDDSLRDGWEYPVDPKTKYNTILEGVEMAFEELVWNKEENQ